MRTIERMAQAFATLITERARPAEQERAIEDILSEHLNVDPLFLFSNLEQKLDDVDARLAFEVGRLIEIYGDAKAERGAESARAYQFAARFTAVSLAERLQSEDDALALLERISRRVQLTDAVYAELLRRLEARGEYARAEDVLFLSLEYERSAERLEHARAFYDRLQAMSDDALCAGGLSRAEVEEAIAQLR